jgi:hypothetical protein
MSTGQSTRTVSSIVLLSLGLALGAGCGKEAAPPPAPAAPPPAPPSPPVAPADGAAPRSKMVANPDGLSLAERIAKRERAEKKLAAELAEGERDRLRKYDRTKLPLHTQVFAFITKTRAQYDALEAKLPKLPKDKAKAEVEKLAGSQRASIEATAKKMATIDPQGGNSNVTTDYDVMLNALANDYPEALAASLDGEAKPLAEQKAELDKRTKKITDWLAGLKSPKR